MAFQNVCEGNLYYIYLCMSIKGRQINAENLIFLHLLINEDFTIC
jgi:hypothetical protein